MSLVSAVKPAFQKSYFSHSYGPVSPYGRNTAQACGPQPQLAGQVSVLFGKSFFEACAPKSASQGFSLDRRI